MYHLDHLTKRIHGPLGKITYHVQSWVKNYRQKHYFVTFFMKFDENNSASSEKEKKIDKTTGKKERKFTTLTFIFF